MEFSTLIGKPLLSPAGENFGYVLQVYLKENLSSVSCLLCADCDEEEFFLSFSAVHSTGDVLIAENCRLESPLGVPCPVGKAVFDEHGSFLGAAKSLTDGGVLTVVGAIGEREFSAKQLTVNETVVVRYASAKKRPQPKKEKPRRVDPVPEDTSDEYRLNLLGKRLQKAVTGLAEAGEIITAELIGRARESNRLLELTANTLTEA